jgi:cyclic nucleotide gated channel beta 1
MALLLLLIVLQAMVFLYNAWVIPLRAVFPFAYTSKNMIPWMMADYFGDSIYLLDMFVYKRRLMFMENGFWVKNKRRLTRQYVLEGTFRYDVAALAPLEILYLVLGVDATYLRLPRMIKVIAFWEFTERLDSILAKPYFLRIVKTITYMLYLIHLNACAYYAISAWEGIGRNEFVYNGDGNAYVRCFYFATKVMIVIYGD